MTRTPEKRMIDEARALLALHEARRQITDEDRHMIAHFIRYKGDITRWTGWEARKDVIMAAYPTLVPLIDEVEQAERDLLDLVERIEEDYVNGDGDA